MTVQVSIENMTGLERRMKIRVPAERVDEVMEACFQKFAKTAKVNGFRQGGKIPRKILESQPNWHLIRREEAIPQIIRTTLEEAFKQSDAKPAGSPMLENFPELEGTGKELEYTVVFDVFPDFELNTLDGVEIEQIVSKVSDADLDKAIDQLRQENAEWVKKEAPAKVGDVVEIDSSVRVNGEEVALESLSKAKVKLGSHTLLIAPVEEKLAGVSAGDEIVVKAEYPADYPAPSVAGKKAEFSIKVHGIEEAVLPELNEAFIKKFDVEGGAEEFKKAIRSSMEYYLKTTLENLNKTAVFNAFAKVNPIDLPKSLVRSEVEMMGRALLQQMFGNKIPKNQQNLNSIIHNLYEKSAENRVRLSLLVEKLLSAEPVSISEEQIKEAVKERAALYKDPDAWAEGFLSDSRNRSEVENGLKEAAIVKRIREKSKIKEKNLDYFAVIALVNSRGKEEDEQSEPIGHEHHHVHGEHCQHDSEEV